MGSGEEKREKRIKRVRRKRPLHPSFLLLVATVVFFFFYVPGSPQRLHDVPSPDAIVVTHHDRLGSRIDLLTTNSAVRAGMFAGGVTSKKIRKWRDDPETSFLLEELLPGRGMAVYEPELGPSFEDGWVIAGWIGSRQMTVKLTFETVAMKKYKRVGSHRGVSIFSRRKPKKDRDPVTFAVFQGMALVVHHPRLDAIHEVIDRVAGDRLTLKHREPEMLALLDPEGEAHDRTFVQWKDHKLLGSITYLTEEDAELKFSSEDLRPYFEYTLSAEHRHFLGGLVSNTYLASAHIPGNVPEWAAGGSLSILGGAGRVNTVLPIGFQLPSLLWVEHVGSEEDALTVAAERMATLGDWLDTEWKQVEMGEGPILASYSAKNFAVNLNLIPPNNPAVAYVDGYLLLCNSARILEYLVENRLPADVPRREGFFTSESVWFECHFPEFSRQYGVPVLRFLQSPAGRALAKSDKQARKRIDRATRLPEDLLRLPYARIEQLPAESHPLPTLRIRIGQFENEPSP